MSDAIRTTEAGRQAFVQGDEPWWGQAKQLNDATSLDEALDAAGHGYEVVIVPSYQRVEIEGGDEFYRPVEGTNYTIRADTKEVLGTVGDRYTPIQNRDAFRVLEPLLDRGLAFLESGATLYNGSDVFMSVRLNPASPEVQEFQQKHGLKSFGLMHNNHSGKHKLGLQTTDVRTVCRNTLRMAQANARKGIDSNIQIRHTKEGLSNTIAAAKELWGRIDMNQQKAAKDYQLMMDTMLTDAQFEKLVLDVVLPIAKDDPDSSRGRTLKEKQLLRRAAVTDRWMNGIGHDGTPSAYYAYNGAIEAMDHEPKVFAVRGGAEDRQFSLMTGTLNSLKLSLADSLVTFAMRA